MIPKNTPTQPQVQSIVVDPESPQIVDLSEGEISDSKQEGPDSGTSELDQLMLTAEEQFSLVGLQKTVISLYSNDIAEKRR